MFASLRDRIRNIDWVEFAVIAVPVALLLACIGVIIGVFVSSANGIQEGTITDKNHSSTLICTGKPVICSTSQFWSFDLENESGETNTVFVGPGTYNNYNVGDYYIND